MFEIDSHGGSSIRYLLCVVGTMGALIFASAASHNQAFKKIQALTHADWSDGGRYSMALTEEESSEKPFLLRFVR